MIYFDIDGVIRDLDGYFGKRRTEWHMKVNGMTLVEAVDSDMRALTETEPLPFLEVIREFNPEPTFMTVQPANWIKPTMEWIGKHVPGAAINFTPAPTYKLWLLKPGDLLVEDYPFFEDYSRIILIDWPYNQNVKNPYARVRTPDELRDIIREKGAST